MIKTIVATIVAAAIAVGGYFGSVKLLAAAYQQGAKDYHGMCFYMPGLRLDTESQTVVYCYGLGQAPQIREAPEPEERKNNRVGT
jgi:hypothetical protein